jgi:hypothetical protein
MSDTRLRAAVKRIQDSPQRCVSLLQLASEILRQDPTLTSEGERQADFVSRVEEAATALGYFKDGAASGRVAGDGISAKRAKEVVDEVLSGGRSRVGTEAEMARLSLQPHQRGIQMSLTAAPMTEARRQQVLAELDASRDRAFCRGPRGGGPEAALAMQGIRVDEMIDGLRAREVVGEYTGQGEDTRHRIQDLLTRGSAAAARLKDHSARSRLRASLDGLRGLLNGNREPGEGVLEKIAEEIEAAEQQNGNPVSAY